MSGTDVYVTNNEKGRDNEIFLSSSGGEIRTYLLPSQTNENQLYPPSIPNTPMTGTNENQLYPPSIPNTPMTAPMPTQMSIPMVSQMAPQMMAPMTPQLATPTPLRNSVS